jgi:lactoylglutathione lyase
MRVSLDQYCINVSDLARSERFYTEGLGLAVTHRIEIPGVSELVLEGASGNRLQLAHHDGYNQPIQHGNGLWKLYLNTDDCAGLYARAIAAGAEAVSPPNYLAQWNVHVAFVRDPDGYLFEIVQMDAPPRG